MISGSKGVAKMVMGPSFSYLTPDVCCRQSMCIEHTESAHGTQAGALAAALLKAGQKHRSADPDGQSWPVTGADAVAMLSKMRSTDSSLPAMKQEAAVKLLRYVCP